MNSTPMRESNLNFQARLRWSETLKIYSSQSSTPGIGKISITSMRLPRKNREVRVIELTISFKDL